MILAMATAPLPLIELRTLHCCTRQSIFSPQPPQECITPCTPLSRSASALCRESRSVRSLSLSRVRSQPPENAMHAHGFVQIYVHGRGWFPFPHSAPRADSLPPPPLARRKMHALAGELCSRRGTRVHDVIAYTLYVSG